MRRAEEHMQTLCEVREGGRDAEGGEGVRRGEGALGHGRGDEASVSD